MLKRVAAGRCSAPTMRIWRGSPKHRNARERRTHLLKLKAEAELARLKEQPAAVARKEAEEPSAGKDSSKNAPQEKPKPVDPEKIKAGYQKAIELAPKAAGQMERAAKALKLKDRAAAYPPAEEARKVLEEIQKAQPPEEQKKQDQKDQEKKKDEQQKQDQKNQDKKKDEQKKQDQEDQEKKKDERQKKDQEKKDQQKKDQEKKKQEDQSSSGEDKQERKQQFSRDQIEQALRKVRERQQEKRERDRKMKARVIGRAPVEKDW